MPAHSVAQRVTIVGPLRPGFDTVLTNDALAFLGGLAQFAPRVRELLERRVTRQAELDKGAKLDFLPETASIRSQDWTIDPVPADLRDRRVEITGPVDRKMIINALNSGAKVFMADFEDSNAPSWENVIGGQLNLRDAVNRSIRYIAPDTGKSYALEDHVATLVVRPRGWHLIEKHLHAPDGRPMPAALVDFGLYFFHNAKALLAMGTGPYFYLPKLESHLEARLWNDVFVHAQQALGLPAGTIKATVLIETLPAAFEMDEILYELRQHAAGLNCGRWDYMFSFIKKLAADPARILPDRAQVTMEQHFLRSYSQLLIQTCHRRGAHAMGGMAAYIPVKGDPEANARALEKVRQDKLREVKDGHDGTWVAHPGLVPVAQAIFDEHMKGENQLEVKREDVHVTAEDLLRLPIGTRTEAGLRSNIRVGVRYLEAWLGGQGCVPLYNLMEDAATAEISRAQVWQWVKHRATLEDGQRVDVALFRRALSEELLRIEQEVGKERYAHGRFPLAAGIFDQLVTHDRFEEFLTLPAYEVLLASTERAA
ncbi:MAG: malate synthase A [Deltaproteobacteria bacterium]|nr:malate synthase A [Deltaproteobacteria bacterium]